MHARSGLSAQVEDLRHFILECPAYGHIREKYPRIFSYPASSIQGLFSGEAAQVQACNGLLQRIFASKDQEQLVDCVWSMDLYRRHVLQLPMPSAVDIGHLLPSATYVPRNCGFTCGQDNGIPAPRFMRVSGTLIGLALALAAVLLTLLWIASSH